MAALWLPKICDAEGTKTNFCLWDGYLSECYYLSTFLKFSLATVKQVHLKSNLKAHKNANKFPSFLPWKVSTVETVAQLFLPFAVFSFRTWDAVLDAQKVKLNFQQDDELQHHLSWKWIHCSILSKHDHDCYPPKSAHCPLVLHVQYGYQSANWTKKKRKSAI